MHLDLYEGRLQTFQDYYLQFALWILERLRVAPAGMKSYENAADSKIWVLKSPGQLMISAGADSAAEAEYTVARALLFGLGVCMGASEKRTGT